MKTTSSEKAYSWLWDSHISPNNNKWLAENLEEMDKLVKEMLKLIEEEGDTFAKKADMYYQRRPELVAHVETFYRMYRAVAERYDNVTVELRRSVSKEPHSGDSDSGSSSSSPFQSPGSTPEDKLSKHKTRDGAAGFEFFLGTGGKCSRTGKSSDLSSVSSGSESESDSAKEEDSHDYEHNGVQNVGSFQFRILELEKELSSAIEKLGISEVEIARLNQELENNSLAFASKIAVSEEELTFANGRLHASEEMITRLKKELEESVFINHKRCEELDSMREQIHALDNENKRLYHEIEEIKSEHVAHIEQLRLDIVSKDSFIVELASSQEHNLHEKQKIEARLEELQASVGTLVHEKSILEDKVHENECKINELQDLLSSSVEKFSEAKHEIVTLQLQLNSTEREVEELNKCMDRLKHETDTRAREIDELRAKMISREAQLSCMDGEISRMQVEHGELVREKMELQGRVRELEEEVERQRMVIFEGAESKREAIRQLCSSLDYYRVGYMELRQVLRSRARPRPVPVC